MRTLSMPRGVSLERFYVAVTVLAFGLLPLLVFTLTHLSIEPLNDHPQDLKPLEKFYQYPNDSNEVVNPHPFQLLLDPGTSICSGQDVFLLVYVHSAPHHGHRRALIRRTWGDVTQYEVPIRVVFVMGLPEGGSTREARIRAEHAQHKDIVQEDFIDTYYNITYKSVAALGWVVTNCPEATFVLKADDDAFVDMFTLLRFLTRAADARPSLTIRKILCNLWLDSVPRHGKWGLEKSVFRFEYYPPFCQGLAFVMSRDLVEPLYNATFYTPFLRMDDVFLTGFAIRRVIGAEQVEMNSFFVDESRLRELIGKEDLQPPLFAHIKNLTNFSKLWAAVKSNPWGL